MLVYEKVLNVLGGMPTIQRQRELNELSEVTSNRYELIVTALSGTIAGVVSWILAIPFDVLKTIMQADAATKYDSMAHCIKVNMEVCLYAMHRLYSASEWLTSKWLRNLYNTKMAHPQNIWLARL